MKKQTIPRYEPKILEPKWQRYWQAHKTFVAREDKKKQKRYVLVEFPYPSGEGLHMGHLRPFVAGDVYSRYLRLKGFEVLYPFGWDAFGLPAENFAIKKGVHPSVSTKKNIRNAKRQVLSWGTSFDWSREVNTTDPGYYRWTQWIFLQFYKAGLAYEATGLINWCPKDKTGLANEEVIDGKCERCGTEVEKKELRQWYLKITAYAEQLLDGLKTLGQWPEAVKTQQENWIGRSAGAEVDFQIAGTSEKVSVFTTRPDTLFGATYLVLAPEHPLLEQLKDRISNWAEVSRYAARSRAKKDVERVTAAERDKTGVAVRGLSAVNPATGESVPVWVADYVLWGYGTGAIMAVPAHDERDFAFAKKFGLPVTVVVEPTAGERGAFVHLDDADTSEAAAAVRRLGEGREHQTPSVKLYFVPERRLPELVAALERGKAGTAPERQKILSGESFTLRGRSVDFSHVFAGDGIHVNSDFLNGLRNEEAKAKVTAWLEQRKAGRGKVEYRMRDWVFSRQRYWGEPIPLIHCARCGTVPVPERELPVKLPSVKRYEPTGTGESPLAAVAKWVNVRCPECGGKAERETNTMPQWAGSSWYWLRYADPRNAKQFASKAKLSYWQPVDVYFGGMEHTTLHLLYSRFWNRFLYDRGLVTEPEPYQKRQPHGIVLAHDGEKMSKSRGNVVNPDDIVKRYGADTLRMHELFLGPHESSVSWNDRGIVGVRRFLDRVWLWVHEIARAPHAKKRGAKDSERVARALSRLTKKVTEDLESFRFNTAVAAFMEFHNEVKQEFITLESLRRFLVLLYPFAPHITEELRQALGGKQSAQAERWPIFDAALLASAVVQIVVQVNGKVKGKVEAPVGAAEDEVRALTLELEAVKKLLAGESVKRTIYVPGRLINLVV